LFPYAEGVDTDRHRHAEWYPPTASRNNASRFHSAAIATGAGLANAASSSSRRTAAFARFASFTGPNPLI
jgi:hypothetical protein